MTANGLYSFNGAVFRVFKIPILGWFIVNNQSPSSSAGFGLIDGHLIDWFVEKNCLLINLLIR